MCPSNPLEFVLANSINTFNEVHNTHFGTDLQVEEPLSIERHGLIDQATLKIHTNTYLHFQHMMLCLMKLIYVKIICYILELKIENLYGKLT